MGFLKHLRSKSRPKEIRSNPPRPSYASPARWGRDFTTRLPATILAKIFIYVCPHTRDETYEPCEQSQIGEGCMLCDLRDLAVCAQVSRKWYSIAQTLLYRSIRIDAVHYCALEEVLTERRRKTNKSLRGKHGVDPGEVPNIRLALLARTLRSNEKLANQVLLLKIPYMARETAKGDLARTVSALSNLQYVDLPDGFFAGDNACVALRQELQASCPDIRKMSYRAGSEEALEWLATRHWQALENLELSGLALEPATMRIVLASLPRLRDLTLSDMEWMDDSIFQSSPGQLPEFPPLELLKLENIPYVTARGLTHYLQGPRNRETLSSLTLHNTGAAIPDLHSILWTGSSLRHIAVLDVVSKSMALSSQQIPPLSSISLETMNFEITSSDDAHGLQKPAESYYAYLASSLHQNALPALRTLYVRDQTFADLLLMPPIAGVGSDDRQSLRSRTDSASFHLPPSARNFAGGGFNQTLEIFSKGIDELEWVFTTIEPPSHPGDNRGSILGGRPLSALSASRGLGPQWAQGGFGGEARKSVIVGNGFGGFLAVPQEEAPRPATSDNSMHDRNSRWGGGGLSSPTAAGFLRGNGGLQSPTAAGFLKPPPSLASLPGSALSKQERRGSRHDLWR